MAANGRPTNPRLVAAQDRVDAAAANFEKQYARFRRAFTRLEKARRECALAAKALKKAKGE